MFNIGDILVHRTAPSWMCKVVTIENGVARGDALRVPEHLGEIEYWVDFYVLDEVWRKVSLSMWTQRRYGI